MKRAHTLPVLSSQVQVLREVRDVPADERSIRRPILIDRATSLLHELPTVYVQRRLGKKALNTQISALYDLAFFLEWVRLKSARSKAWVRPEARIRAGKLALSQAEVDDLANWCQYQAKDISGSVGRETDTIRILLPRGSGVEGSTSNSRLHNICNYLCWLTREMVAGTLMLDDRLLAKNSTYEESLQRAFRVSICSVKSSHSVTSLNYADSRAFRQVVQSNDEHTSAHDVRNNLIGRILIEAGLRAGELLKLQCDDLDANFEVQSGKLISVLKIIKRPNDIDDDRLWEPSAKTLPGPIAISRNLATAIINYIGNERRNALNRRKDGRETPYLFVSHSGKHAGYPMSYRNLHKIISNIGKAASIRKVLAPHILRHTHFTELRDLLARKGVGADDARRVLQERGHWSPNSSMPDHYSQRFLAEQQAHYAELRDQILEPGTDD